MSSNSDKEDVMIDHQSFTENNRPPPSDWMPIANTDFRRWGPWVFHGCKRKRPDHIQFNSIGGTRHDISDVVVYLTSDGSGWGRNHSPVWEEIVWYRMRADHPYYKEIAKTREYEVGPLTIKYVFEKSGLTNLSDKQALLDSIEIALTELTKNGELS